jgi:atypical dual specificity phosphatase
MISARRTHGGVDEVPLPHHVPGRLWLCGKHVIAPDPDAVLNQIGATTVVCLTQAHELEARWPDYVAWLRAEPATRALWRPIDDFGVPPAEARQPLLDDLAARLLAGDGLVIHCAAGIGRSGTTAAALLVGFGMSVDEARAHVRRHRPMAGPEAGEQLDWLSEIAAQRDGR